MSYILDITTAVPAFSVPHEEFLNFYSKSLSSQGIAPIDNKIRQLNTKTKINKRYSCIEDFNGTSCELFNDGNYNPSVEKRNAVYKQKILPLASSAINKLLKRNEIKPTDITHLITISCTGLFAPGIEFLIADEYSLQHTEKLALNFLGCYASIKGLKHAQYIAKADPSACILIVSVELCSLHFHPSTSNEDIISNLLFSDGAAAALVCGKSNEVLKNKTTFNIDAIGSACIPDTLDLMTWNISSSAFRMYLSKDIVKALKMNIKSVVSNF